MSQPPPTRNPLVITDRILSEILAERVRQDDHHGQRNHPDGTGDRRWQDAANVVRGEVGDDARAGRTTWNGLVRKELFEVLAESHPVRLQARLLYLATTAVEWIEDVDRRINAQAAVYVPPATHVRDDGVDCCPHTVPVAPGSCADCWDLVKWDLLGGEQQ